MFVLAFVLPLAFAYTIERTDCPENKAPECMEGQILCSGNVDVFTGCPLPGYCTDMYDMYSKDNDGNPCPNSCYIECNWLVGDYFCPNPSNNGCDNTGGYCVPKSSDNCPPQCPVTCKDGEILCSGGVDSWNNCPRPGYCKAPVGDCPAVCDMPACNFYNGENFCPYGEGPYGLDSNGCWMGGYCSEPHTECADTTAK